MKLNDRSSSETPNEAVVRIVRGVLRVGTGHSDGLNHFRSASDAVLRALVPSLAMIVVAFLAKSAANHFRVATAESLFLLAASLMPLVVTHFLACLWGKEERWTRYAAAVLWCKWLPSIVLMTLLGFSRASGSGGHSGYAATGLIVIAAEGYGLWLSWFIARCGLEIPGGKAALLVAAVSIVTVLLYLPILFSSDHHVIISEFVKQMGR